MSNSLDQTLKLRAQEIIEKASGPILVADALEQAIVERKLSQAELVKMLAALGANLMKGLRVESYQLPERTGHQLSLFDVPAVIGITTPQGDLLVSKDVANLGEVRQWIREGERHHSVQLLRFNRAEQDIVAIEDLEDKTGWSDARKALDQRSRAGLTRTEADE